MADGIKLNFDLGAVEPWDGTQPGMNNPPPGAYKGKTTAAEPYVAKAAKAEGSTTPTSYKITVESEVGQVDFYPGLDFSSEANRKKMVTALLSCGLKREMLGKVKEITPALFMGPKGDGRPCYFIVKKVEGMDGQGRPKLNDKEFITREQFETWTAAHAGNGGAKPAAAPAAGKPAAAAPADDVNALFEE